MTRPDVVVVGSGPNGLAAAVTLARAGLGVVVLESQPTVGGGARTLDLGLAEGVTHDVCSAVHPMAWASPFFASFDLRSRGVELLVPEVSYAHPLADARAGVGVLRFPDLLARMHAGTKPQVLGLALVLIGLALRLRSGGAVWALVLVAVFQMLTAPVAAHMVGRAGYRTGKVRSDLLVVDELTDDQERAQVRDQGRPDDDDPRD